MMAEDRDLVGLDTASDLIDSPHEENAERFMSSLASNPWGLSPKAMTAKQAAMRALSTKTGLYANIPITCKGDACPYAETCKLLPYDLAPEGEYCPVEIAHVEQLAVGYYRDFDLDDMSMTDKSLLDEVIFLDIMLERCRAILAKEGTPVTDILIGMTERGEEIRQPNVSRAWEAYEKITKRKDQKLQLLAQTRNIKMKQGGDEKQESWLQTITQNITAEDIEAVSG